MDHTFFLTLYEFTKLCLPNRRINNENIFYKFCMQIPVNAHLCNKNEFPIIFIIYLIILQNQKNIQNFSQYLMLSGIGIGERQKTTKLIFNKSKFDILGFL